MPTITNGQSAEHATQERPTPERKEPTFLFTEKYVSEKSELARRFLDTRERLNGCVDKANNFLVKRFLTSTTILIWTARSPPRRKSSWDW
jgi:hypothetical protein